MKTTHPYIQWPALVMLVGLAACSDPGAVLTQNELSPINDVPIPAGFTLEEPRSRDITDGTLRYVDHLYSGGADKLAVTRFYERQMPMNRWEQLSSQRIRGRTTLDFVKDQEKCRINIYDMPGSWSTALEVIIWAHTRSAPKPMLPKTPQ